MSRFFAAPEQIGAEVITIEDPGDLKHMAKVLRLKPGDEVDISDGSEWEYRAEILSLDREEAQFKILDRQKCAAEPQVRITLYQGIPKQGKMETIIQKCVELGVHRVVPVFMDRTVVVDKGNFGRKIDRWQKVSAESVKQCRRGMIPEVTEAMRMQQVIAELPAGGYDLVLIPYEDEKGTTIKDVLREHMSNLEDVGNTETTRAAGGNAEDSGSPGAGPQNIAVLIGPEGGFSNEEVAAVTAAGGHSVTLGKTTLRTETAGMAAIAMIMYELEL